MFSGLPSLTGDISTDRFLQEPDGQDSYMQSRREDTFLCVPGTQVTGCISTQAAWVTANISIDIQFCTMRPDLTQYDLQRSQCIVPTAFVCFHQLVLYLDHIPHWGLHSLSVLVRTCHTRCHCNRRQKISRDTILKKGQFFLIHHNFKNKQIPLAGNICKKLYPVADELANTYFMGGLVGNLLSAIPQSGNPQSLVVNSWPNSGCIQYNAASVLVFCSQKCLLSKYNSWYCGSTHRLA